MSSDGHQVYMVIKHGEMGYTWGEKIEELQCFISYPMNALSVLNTGSGVAEANQNFVPQSTFSLKPLYRVRCILKKKNGIL